MDCFDLDIWKAKQTKMPNYKSLSIRVRSPLYRYKYFFLRINRERNRISSRWILLSQTCKRQIELSGCVSAGRAVAYDTRCLQFESRYPSSKFKTENLWIVNCWKDDNKDKEAEIVAMKTKERLKAIPLLVCLIILLFFDSKGFKCKPKSQPPPLKYITTFSCKRSRWWTSFFQDGPTAPWPKFWGKQSNPSRREINLISLVRVWAGVSATRFGQISPLWPKF